MNELGYTPEVAPAVLHFLTERLGDKDISDLRRAIPRKDLVEAWKDLDANAHTLAKRLMGKEAATPSRTWQLLSSARPEMILFLAITARQQSVAQKIKNFFTKWRQVKQKIPLPEMTELHITPEIPTYRQDRERCVPAAARWQVAFADGNVEVSEAACAATASATASAASEAGSRSQGCSRSSCGCDSAGGGQR